MKKYTEGTAKQYIAHKLDKSESNHGYHWKYVRGWQLKDDVKKLYITIFLSDTKKILIQYFSRYWKWILRVFNLYRNHRTWGFFYQHELAMPALCFNDMDM